MSKNLKSPITLQPVRETFGIINPATQERYEDVIFAFIQLRDINITDLELGLITQNEIDITPYILHLDSKTRRVVKKDKILRCVVSFQNRTTGNFAFARLPRF